MAERIVAYKTDDWERYYTLLQSANSKFLVLEREMIKEICSFINIPVTTFEKNNKQIQTTPELLEKKQQHDIGVLSSLNKFDQENFDLDAFREAYMEFLHMSQMMVIKMERLTGKSDQYV